MIKIVFFGTPEFATHSLDAIIKNGYDVVCVVTVPDRVGGRGNKVIESDVKKYAKAHKLPILQPERLRDEEFLSQLRSFNADLFIVIAFRMLPKLVWEMPPMGTFNLHASLLPEFRGAAPINHAIMAGKEKTGVTTFFINEEIDKGNILMSSETVITEEDNAGTLHDRLMELGAGIVIETIRGLENKSLIPRPQPADTESLPAPKIFKDNCKIDFRQSAVKIDRFIRGLAPYPGAWAVIMLEDGREFEVKILKTRFPSEEPRLLPGEVDASKKRIIVGTSDTPIEILEIQPSGKRRMEAKEFLAGYKPIELI